MRLSLRPLVILLGMAALFASSIAEAQWVMLARHVMGRVEQMSQQSPQAGGANYDSATVMLEAPADKVYATVVRGVKNAQGITVTREDASTMLIQFTNGHEAFITNDGISGDACPVYSQGELTAATYVRPS